MKILDEQTFSSMTNWTAGLFFFSPFCGTCQLAERMLAVAAEAAAPDYPIYKCRVSEWRKCVNQWRIRSVPCLVLLENGSIKKTTYKIESAVHLYALLRA